MRHIALETEHVEPVTCIGSMKAVLIEYNWWVTRCFERRTDKQSRVRKHGLRTRISNKINYAEELNFRNDGIVVSEDNRQVNYN